MRMRAVWTLPWVWVWARLDRASSAFCLALESFERSLGFCCASLPSSDEIFVLSFSSWLFSAWTSLSSSSLAARPSSITAVLAFISSRATAPALAFSLRIAISLSATAMADCFWLTFSFHGSRDFCLAAIWSEKACVLPFRLSRMLDSSASSSFTRDSRSEIFSARISMSPAHCSIVSSASARLVPSWRLFSRASSVCRLGTSASPRT